MLKELKEMKDDEDGNDCLSKLVTTTKSQDYSELVLVLETHMDYIDLVSLIKYF
jgi:hypothetical protein